MFLIVDILLCIQLSFFDCETYIKITKRKKITDFLNLSTHPYLRRPVSNFLFAQPEKKTEPNCILAELVFKRKGKNRKRSLTS